MDRASLYHGAKVSCSYPFRTMEKSDRTYPSYCSCSKMKLLRVVVREDFSRSRCEDFIRDLDGKHVQAKHADNMPMLTDGLPARLQLPSPP